MRPRACDACGAEAVLTERLCERHLLDQNIRRMGLGYLTDWVALELELWPDLRV